MNKIKNFWFKWGSLIVFAIFFLLGIYLGGWLVFLKPVIHIVTTTTLSWGGLGSCILRFILGDVVISICWFIGGILMILIDD